MNNEAIFDKKALNQLKKITGSGGGMVLVDTLPEIGDEKLLYKTPDGKIWSCINSTTEETICDLEVGESFTLKDKILAGDIVGLCDTLGEGKHPFEIIARTSGIVIVKISSEDTDPEYEFVYAQVDGGSETSVQYDATDIPLTDLVTGELHGFRELPSVEITETLVENLTSANLELIDLAFAFVDGSHTEEVTTSTWTEVGSSGGASGVTKVNMTYNESTGVTLSATTEQIFNMLQNGIVVVTGNYYGVNYNAIIVDGSYSEGIGYDFTIYSNSDRILTYEPDNDIWYIQIPV